MLLYFILLLCQDGTRAAELEHLRFSRYLGPQYWKGNFWARCHPLLSLLSSGTCAPWPLSYLLPQLHKMFGWPLPPYFGVSKSALHDYSMSHHSQAGQQLTVLKYILLHTIVLNPEHCLKEEKEEIIALIFSQFFICGMFKILLVPTKDLDLLYLDSLETPSMFCSFGQSKWRPQF